MAGVVDVAESPASKLMVGDVLPRRRDIVCITEDASVEELLAALNKQKILSAPVVRRGKAEAGAKRAPLRIVGAVDVLDVALLLVGRLTGANKDVSDATAVAKVLNTDVGTLLRAARAFRAAENPFLDERASVDVDAPLASMLTLMWGGWHRVAVTKPLDADVATYVSQSDVVAFFAQHMPLVLDPALRRRSLGALGFRAAPADGKAKLVTAPPSDSAYSVLVRCVQEQVSAVPVVDPVDGRVVGTFSASELRGLGEPSAIADLALPVADYVAKYAADARRFVFPASRAGLAPATPHTCTLDDAFELVLYKIAALRVHRLWLVDANARPIGSVSLTDLMRVFVLGAPHQQQQQQQQVQEQGAAAAAAVATA